MKFSYIGRDSQNMQVTGIVSAVSKTAASKELRGQGIKVSQITDVVDAVFSNSGRDRRSQKSHFFSKKPAVGDYIIMCHQLHTLLKGGVTLLNALQSMLPYIDNKMLNMIIGDVISDLEAGFTMTQAVERHDKHLPDTMIGMVQAGEVTGNMEEVFLKLGGYFEKEKATQEKIREVLRYPIIVIAVLVLALLVINVMILPVFSKMFERFGSELPLLTQVLLDVSGVINAYWKWAVSLSGLGYIAWGRWRKTSEGKRIWDKYKLKLPLVGEIMHRGTLSRLCHSIAMTFSSGMPIIQGLTIAGTSTGSDFFMRKTTAMAKSLEEGNSLTEVAQRSGVFHPFAMQMMAAGEMTGAIDETLSRVASYYDREIEQDIKAISEKIEPILILGVGGLVMVLALGVFIPLWDMSTILLGRTA